MIQAAYDALRATLTTSSKSSVDSETTCDFRKFSQARSRWRRRALTPLERRNGKTAWGQAVSRINFPALARKMSVSAYLGKRASRSFLDLRSTSETLVVRDNQDGCLPILVTGHMRLVTCLNWMLGVGCWRRRALTPLNLQMKKTAPFSTLPCQLLNPSPLVRAELEFLRRHVLLWMRER